MVPIPADARDLTPGWFSAALGLGVETANVAAFGQDEAFTGGALYRVLLGGTAASKRLVVKMSPQEPTLRMAMAGANAREVEFYTRLTQLGDMPVPNCLFGACDPATGASVLVLEDLFEGVQVPFALGCSPEHAAAVVRALAQVHVAHWRAFEPAPGVAARIAEDFDFPALWAGYGDALHELLPDPVLPPRLLSLGNAFAQGPGPVLEGLFGQGPQTILHRDIHLDNILFLRGAAGQTEARLIDWQLTAQGPGGLDLGYFLCSSLEPEHRRRTEQDLVRIYAAELHKAGLHGYGVSEISSDVRRAGIWKLFVSVIATCVLDNATPHKRAWRAHDFRRLCAFLEDHDISHMDLQPLLGARPKGAA